jgi:hypothetical protein
MVETSVDHPPETSEVDVVGLARAASERVAPPRIEECAVALECRLDRVLEVGTSAVCIGEVVLFHVRDDVLADGEGGPTVDPARLRPVGRLGGTEYAPLREVWSITPLAGPDPVWAPQHEVVDAARRAMEVPGIPADARSILQSALDGYARARSGSATPDNPTGRCAPR